MLDNLVAADNPNLVDEDLSDDEAKGVYYGSQAAIFTDEELEQWS